MHHLGKQCSFLPCCQLLTFPRPCYVGLKNNVGTRLLATTLNPFPPGVEDYVSHSVLKDYIQDTAWKSGVHQITSYDTEVKHITKIGGQWEVESSTLVRQCNGRIERRIATSVSNACVLKNPKVTLYRGLTL